MTENEFAPVTPGEMLKNEFLMEYALSQNQLAKAIGISPNRIAVKKRPRGKTPRSHLLDHLRYNEPVRRDPRYTGKEITDSRVPRLLDHLYEILGLLCSHIARADVIGAAKPLP